MEIVDLSEVYCRSCSTLAGCECNDYTNSRKNCVQRLIKSLQSSGFVQIVRHGVDKQIISASFSEARSFFNRKTEFKESCMSKDRARRGYSPAATENFASLIGVAGKPNDAVQKYRIGPVVESSSIKDDPYYSTKEGRIHFYPNNDTELDDNFPVASTQYRLGMESLAKQLLQLILHCSDVPSSSFDGVLDKHTSILSLNYYESLRTTNNSEPAVRVEAHTDVSLITIVAQCAQSGTAAGALQVFINSEKEGSGEFVTVPYIPGALVVNVGDCLHDWSRGRYPSALHRVVSLSSANDTDYSSNQESSDQSRCSLAYFYAPNYDALMQWPRADQDDTRDTSTTVEQVVNYSTWRKNHIKKAMQKIKMNGNKLV